MIARELAEWATGEISAPAAVRAAAARHLLDGLGTALAAVRTGAATPAADGRPRAGRPGRGDDPRAPPSASARRPRRWPTARWCTPWTSTTPTPAAWCTPPRSCCPPPSPSVRNVGASGAAVLDAAVAGYETACRVAAAAPHGFHARGLHATMVAGVFSSAVVAARLMGLDAATHRRRARHRRQPGRRAARVPRHRRLDQAAAPRLRRRRRASSPPGSPPPGRPDRRPSSTGRTVSTTRSPPAPPTRAASPPGSGSGWETTAHRHQALAGLPALARHHGRGAGRDGPRTGSPADQVAAVHAVVHPDSASVVCDTGRDLTRPASAVRGEVLAAVERRRGRWPTAASAIDTYAEESLARPEVAALAARVTWDVATAHRRRAADAPGDVTHHPGRRPARLRARATAAPAAAAPR